ncbi:ATP-binding protein [Hymenobacter pini]|uniref:ATP-binding protein n=1 Tax=Hymenobacter pini TaxID=2880879 RepID=UPI001CF3199A|nr:ATP-binding protein [Hymenobacter pini]MCA8829412.1 ATP-binding protein [Hymenobacter pini]
MAVSTSRPTSASKTTKPEPFRFSLPEPSAFQQNPLRQLPLTPEEEAYVTEQALLAAREMKYSQAYGKWYAWQANRPTAPESYSAEQLYQWFQAEASRVLGKPFDIDANNEGIIRLLCQYYAEDPAFEAAGYSLQKGLMLRGAVGCGKTTIMRIFALNPRMPFAVHACREVVSEYLAKDGGEDALVGYKQVISLPDPPMRKYNYRTQAGICFDDLGTENWQARHFANELNVMEAVLDARYNGVFLTGQLPSHATHLTTNLRFNDVLDEATNEVQVKGIQSIYGARCRSRIREMFNVISFPDTATDRRK